MEDLSKLAALGKRIDQVLPELQSIKELVDDATAVQRGQAAAANFMHDAQTLKESVHKSLELVSVDMQRFEACLRSMDAVCASLKVSHSANVPVGRVGTVQKSASKQPHVSSVMKTSTVKAPYSASAFHRTYSATKGYSAAKFATGLYSDNSSVLKPYSNVASMKMNEGPYSYRSLDELGSGSSWLEEPCVTPEVTCKSVKRGTAPFTKAAVPNTLSQPTIAVNDPPSILAGTSQACHSVTSGQRPDSQSPVTLTYPHDAAAAVKCSNEPVTSPYSVDPTAADTRDIEKTVTRSRPWCDEVTETGDRAQASNDATQASDLDDEVKAITSSYRHLLLDTPPSPILLSRQLTTKARFEPSAAAKIENKTSSSNATLEKDNGGESDKVKVTSLNYRSWLKESPPSPVLLSRQLNTNYSQSTTLASSSATISYNSSSMAMSAASETANTTAKKLAMVDDDLKSPFLLSRQLAFQPAAARAAQTGRGDGDGTASISGYLTKTSAPSSPPLLRSRYGDLSTPPSPILLSRMLVNNPPPAAAASSFQPSIFTVTANSAYTHSVKTNHSTASTAATPAAGRSVLTGGTWNSRRATHADTRTNAVSKTTTASAAPTFSDEENTARGQSKHLHRKSSRMSCIPQPTAISRHGR